MTPFHATPSLGRSFTLLELNSQGSSRCHETGLEIAARVTRAVAFRDLAANIVIPVAMVYKPKNAGLQETSSYCDAVFRGAYECMRDHEQVNGNFWTPVKEGLLGHDSSPFREVGCQRTEPSGCRNCPDLRTMAHGIPANCRRFEDSIE